ncbi:translation initiation factor eIF-2B subunit beta, partial [Tremellales sp. Uapishka_1]
MRGSPRRSSFDFEGGESDHLFQQSIEKLIARLRLVRQIVGSRNVALATAALVRDIVRSVKYSTIDELLGFIQALGKRLVEANPKELAAGNIIRRILRLIREEYRAAAAAHRSAPPSTPGTPYLGPSTPGIAVPSSHYLSNDFHFTPPPGPGMNRQTSLSNFVAMRHSRAQLERSGSVLDFSLSPSTSSLFAAPNGSSPSSPNLKAAATATAAEIGFFTEAKDEFMKQSSKLKPVLIQAIDEVVNELETTHEDVARGAREHVHSSEIILTMGHSKTVEAFLKQAFRDRKFTVIVAESSPSYLGHSMATALSTAGIPTILVPDSSLFALMPRITKVILGAHSVLANGGLFALSGSLAMALAARAHSKPVVITTGQYKFAPAWNSYHEYGAVDFQGPGSVIGYSGNGGGGGEEGVEVVDPYYDYIRPELINLFVTNEGDHSPSYIYRIIKEAYDDEDVEF